MSDNHVYIVAEAGINADGSMDKAKRMIRHAKEAGCDAVKFQTYRTEAICSKKSKQYAWLKKCEFSFDQFRSLNRYARKVGIDFISTPDDAVCATFLASLKPKWMKIGSAMAKDKKFLRFCLDLNVPLIVSTGMMTAATQLFRYEDLRKGKLAILHCTSSYPCPPEDMNLKVITWMQDAPCIIGLSDHSIGHEAALVSIGLGARMLEKHFDIEPWTGGPDASVSVGPHVLSRYVRNIRTAEIMLGDGHKRIMPSEKKTLRILKARGK